MFPTMIGVDTEMATEEPVIRVERTTFSICDRILTRLAKCVPLANGWPLICVYNTILAILSLSVVVYLKALGEWTPFCLYDNWYFLSYYLCLTLVSAIMIPLGDFDLFGAAHPFWRWIRRLGALFLFAELEGMAHILVFFKDIAYEIEFDDEAQVAVWSLAVLGAARLVTVSISYWSGVEVLQRQGRRKQLPAYHFGKTFTDLSDILVTQLLWLSLYFYEFSIYNIGFVVSTAYLYIVWARL